MHIVARRCVRLRDGLKRRDLDIPMQTRSLDRPSSWHELVAVEHKVN